MVSNMKWALGPQMGSSLVPAHTNSCFGTVSKINPSINFIFIVIQLT